MPEYRFKNKVTTDPSDVTTNDAFSIKVVAVAGPTFDWAAYVGPSWWSDQQVADHGDKLPASHAEPLFYVLRVSGREYQE